LAREIATGDRVFLWMSGSSDDAGVVAPATVIAAADNVDKPEYRMPGFEDKYGPPRTRVRIRVDAPLKFTSAVATRRPSMSCLSSAFLPRAAGHRLSRLLL